MLGKEFAALVNDGIFPVVTFTKDIVNCEGYFEPGMRGRLRSVRNSGDDVVIFTVDLSEFEEFNKQFETANYYDKNHVACLNAREAGLYNVKEQYYADCDLEAYIEIEEPHRLKIYEEYKQSGSELTYVQWLEDNVVGLANQLTEMREMF